MMHYVIYRIQYNKKPTNELYCDKGGEGYSDINEAYRYASRWNTEDATRFGHEYEVREYQKDYK